MVKIKAGDSVLFFYDYSKKWLMKVSKKEQFHSHIGVIKHSDAIGKQFGSRLVTNKDKYVWLSDTATIRQKQDKAKYEKAIDLSKAILKIRK